MVERLMFWEFYVLLRECSVLYDNDGNIVNLFVYLLEVFLISLLNLFIGV